MKRLRILLVTATAGLWLSLAPHAATYRVGEAVENFSLVNWATGQPVQLTDFAGKIVLLDWFAWWCPFCQAAAPQLLAGIDDHYAGRGGNPGGIPVVHVGVNLQANQEAQTQNFVTKAGLDPVLHDFSRALANRFFSGGQPLFAIINGVTNSPSHRPWELLYSRQGYGQTSFPVAEFRAAIDAVKAAAVPAIPPRLSASLLVSGGGLTVVLTGEPGRTYRLESSGDLVNWAPEQTVTLTAGDATVQLPAVTDGRFVRAVVP